MAGRAGCRQRPCPRPIPRQSIGTVTGNVRALTGPGAGVIGPGAARPDDVEERDGDCRVRRIEQTIGMGRSGRILVVAPFAPDDPL